jgi:hypothetical protein
MTGPEFVRAIKLVVYDSTIEGTVAVLEEPPGRKPRQSLVALSSWFNRLPEEGKRQLRGVIEQAASLAIFSFFAVLDGVSAIEDSPEKGELELRFVKEGRATLINDPAGEFLHDLFVGEVDDAG